MRSEFEKNPLKTRLLQKYFHKLRDKAITKSHKRNLSIANYTRPFRFNHIRKASTQTGHDPRELQQSEKYPRDILKSFPSDKEIKSPARSYIKYECSRGSFPSAPVWVCTHSYFSTRKKVRR